MQAYRSRSCDASCDDRLIVGAVVGRHIEPGRCDQGNTARATRPWRYGQGDTTRAMRPGRYGQRDLTRAMRPGRYGQGDTARAIRPRRYGQDDTARAIRPGRCGQVDTALVGATMAVRACARSWDDKPLTAISLRLLRFLKLEKTVLCSCNSG